MVLCGDARECSLLGLSQLGDLLVAFDDQLFEFAHVSLEPIDLRGSWVDDRAGLFQGLQAAAELLSEVLVGAGAGGVVPVLLRMEAGAGDGERFGSSFGRMVSQ
ncbi:hypothetical protein ACWGK1_29480 [Streptomyces wedmorensis]